MDAFSNMPLRSQKYCLYNIQFILSFNEHHLTVQVEALLKKYLL